MVRASTLLKPCVKCGATNRDQSDGSCKPCRNIRVAKRRRTVTPRLPSDDVQDDITDERFGSLTVVHKTPSRVPHSTLWMCLCDCGNYRSVPVRDLMEDQVKTCGTHPLRTSHDLLEDARKLWLTEVPVAAIGRKLNVNKGVISGLAHRNRDLFPSRRSA